MKKTLHIFFLLGILAILANGCHSRFDDYIDDATTAIEPAYDFVSISKYTCNAIPGTIQFFNYYTEAQLPSPKGLPQILVPQGAWNGSTTAAFAFKDVDTNITTTIWNEGSRLYVGNKNYSVVLKATVRSIKALKVDPNLLGIIVGTDAGLHWVVATQDVSGYWIDPIIQNSIWTAPVTSISLDSALTEVISGDKTDIIYFTADGNVYTALLQELRNGHGCVFQAYNKLEHKDKYSRPHRAFKVVSSNGIAAFITESHSRSDFTTQDLIDGNINISDLSSAIWIIDNRSDAKRKAAFIKFGDYTLVPFDITYEGDNLYATAIKYKSNLNIEPKVDDTLNVEIENFGLEDAPEPVSGVLVYPTPHYTPLISSFIEIPKDLNGTYIFHKVYTDKNTAYVRGVNQLLQIDGLLAKANNQSFNVLINKDTTLTGIPNELYLWSNEDGNTIITSTYYDSIYSGTESFNVDQNSFLENTSNKKLAQRIMAVTDEFLYYLNSENKIAIQALVTSDETNNFISLPNQNDQWISVDATENIMASAIKTEDGMQYISISALSITGAPFAEIAPKVIEDILITTDGGIDLEISDLKIVPKADTSMNSDFLIVLLAGNDEATTLYRAAIYAFDFPSGSFELVTDTVTDEGNPLSNTYSNYTVGSNTNDIRFIGKTKIVEAGIEEGTYTFSGLFQSGATTSNAWHYNFVMCDNICDEIGSIGSVDINDVHDIDLKNIIKESVTYNVQEYDISALSVDGTFTYGEYNGVLPIESYLLNSLKEEIVSASIEAIGPLRIVNVLSDSNEYYFYVIDTSNPTDLDISGSSYYNIREIAVVGNTLFTLSPENGITMYILQD